MKRIFTGLLILFLISCSEDDSFINNGFVKKVEVKDIYLGNLYSSFSDNYFYNDKNQIIKIESEYDTNSFYEKVYSYDGELIVKEASFLNSELIESRSFEYDNFENLTKQVYSRPNSLNQEMEVIRTYEYYYDSNSKLIREKYTFKNTEPIIYEYNYIGGNKVSYQKTDYSYVVIEYDSKKNPFSGVPYYNKIYDDYLFPTKNKLSIKKYSISNDELTSESKFKNTYSSNGFLVKSESNLEDTGHQFIVTYTYN